MAPEQLRPAKDCECSSEYGKKPFDPESCAHDMFLAMPDAWIKPSREAASA
jgi:hypothetical protein